MSFPKNETVIPLAGQPFICCNNCLWNNCLRLSPAVQIEIKFYFSRDMKIVILGDASVGKTSLIQRYIQGVFTGDNISVG